MKLFVLFTLFSSFVFAANNSLSDQSLHSAVNSLTAAIRTTNSQTESIEKAASTLKNSQEFKRVENSQAKSGASSQILVCSGVDGSLLFISGEIAICSDLNGRLYKVVGSGIGLGAALGTPILLPGVAAKIFFVYAISNSNQVELIRNYDGIKVTGALGWIGGNASVYLSNNGRGQDRRPGTLLISIGYSAGFNFFAGFNGIEIMTF